MAEYDDLIDDPEPPAAGKMVVAEGTPDKEIEKHFETGRLRVVQEKNDIFLSHVMQFIRGDEDAVWGNLRPEYQRRLRWDNKKKSKLIESFIMNVPVPPVFLYETELGKFEVMDGQQRLNAIAEFFVGSFKLEGLDIWKALNGRNYRELPPLVRKGLERAKISAITLMSDNSSSSEDSLDLRAQVFERLNTGGEQLNQQELRNSLYSGEFNALLIDLSKLRIFTDAWEIPAHEEHTRRDKSVAENLAANTLYKRMTDVEIVLRFFAFRDPRALSGSVRSMLDGTMKKLRHLDSKQVEMLREDFTTTLELCVRVFGKNAFRQPPQSPRKPGKLSRPLYDAEMIAFYRLRDHRRAIVRHKAEIQEAILALAAPRAKTYDLMVGRANTAKAIRDRISIVEATIKGIIDA